GDRQEAFIDEFEVGDDLWNAFWEYAMENGLKFTSDESAVDPASTVYSQSEVESQRDRREVYLNARIDQELFGSEAWDPMYRAIAGELQAAMPRWDMAHSLALYHSADAPSPTGATQ